MSIASAALHRGRTRGIVANSPIRGRFRAARTALVYSPSAAYDDAMKSYQAHSHRERATLSGETTYFDDKNKYTDAAKKFADVATKYPHTRPGQLAAYYAALSDQKLGKTDDAKKWLQGFSWLLQF